MVIFTILLLILLILIVTVVLAIAVGGSIAIILFGDVIVCGFIIVWIMKRLINRKRNKRNKRS